MTKILNIDTILPKNERSLILNGTTYELGTITTEKFLKIVEFQDKYKDTTNFQDQVNLLVVFIATFIPKMDKETILQMDLKQLQLVADFIRDEVPDEMLEGYKAPEKTESDTAQEGTDEGK
jgi:hypothetical protein